MDEGKAPLNEVVWFCSDCCCCCCFDDIGPLETPGLRPVLLLPPPLPPPAPLFEPLELEELLELLEPFLFCIVSLIPSELGFTMYSDALPLALVMEGDCEAKMNHN